MAFEEVEKDGKTHYIPIFTKEEKEDTSSEPKPSPTPSPSPSPSPRRATPEEMMGLPSPGKGIDTLPSNVSNLSPAELHDMGFTPSQIKSIKLSGTGKTRIGIGSEKEIVGALEKSKIYTPQELKKLTSGGVLEKESKTRTVNIFEPVFGSAPPPPQPRQFQRERFVTTDKDAPKTKSEFVQLFGSTKEKVLTKKDVIIAEAEAAKQRFVETALTPKEKEVNVISGVERVVREKIEGLDIPPIEDRPFTSGVIETAKNIINSPTTTKAKETGAVIFSTTKEIVKDNLVFKPEEHGLKSNDAFKRGVEATKKDLQPIISSTKTNLLKPKQVVQILQNRETINPSDVSPRKRLTPEFIALEKSKTLGLPSGKLLVKVFDSDVNVPVALVDVGGFKRSRNVKTGKIGMAAASEILAFPVEKPQETKMIIGTGIGLSFAAPLLPAAGLTAAAIKIAETGLVTGFIGGTTYNIFNEPDAVKKGQILGQGIATATLFSTGAAVGRKPGLALTQFFKNLGKGVRIEPELVFAPSVLQGREAFYSAPQSQHLKIFKQSKGVLPGELKGEIVTHASIYNFENTFKVGKGTSEYRGLFVAPSETGSLAFLRIRPSKGRSLDIGLFSRPGTPQVLRIKPLGIETIPRRVGKSDYAIARFFERTQKKGVAILPLSKTEVQAVLPMETALKKLIKPKGKQAYTTLDGIRVGLLEFEVVTGASKGKRGVQTLEQVLRGSGSSSSSRKTPVSLLGTISSGSGSSITKTNIFQSSSTPRSKSSVSSSISRALSSASSSSVSRSSRTSTPKSSTSRSSRVSSVISSSTSRSSRSSRSSVSSPVSSSSSKSSRRSSLRSLYSSVPPSRSSRTPPPSTPGFPFLFPSMGVKRGKRPKKTAKSPKGRTPQYRPSVTAALFGITSGRRTGKFTPFDIRPIQKPRKKKSIKRRRKKK